MEHVEWCGLHVLPLRLSYFEMVMKFNLDSNEGVVTTGWWEIIEGFGQLKKPFKEVFWIVFQNPPSVTAWRAIRAAWFGCNSNNLNLNGNNNLNNNNAGRGITHQRGFYFLFFLFRSFLVNLLISLVEISLENLSSIGCIILLFSLYVFALFAYADHPSRES